MVADFRNHQQIGAAIIPAYLITAHNEETFAGVIELLAEMYPDSEDDIFIIHVDAKVDNTTYEEFASSIQTVYPKVKFTEKRIPVYWAGWSIVEMELELLREAANLNVNWDMAMLLDGTSWPLTTRAQRQEWLAKLPANSNSVIGQEPKPVCKFNDESGSDCPRSFARCIDEACTRMTNTPNG